jgi:hypothetical protein
MAAASSARLTGAAGRAFVVRERLPRLGFDFRRRLTLGKEQVARECDVEDGGLKMIYRTRNIDNFFDALSFFCPLVRAKATAAKRAMPAQ